MYHFLISLLLVASAHAETGIITKLRGDILVDGKKAEMSTKVLYGQLIEAKGDKSLVALKLESGGRLILRNGSMKLEAPKDQKSSVVQLFKGYLASHYVRKGNATQTVKTKTTTMGVRGTKFYVEEAAETYLCVCEGTVEIDDGKTRVSVNRNEDVKATPGQTLKKLPASQNMVDMATSFLAEAEE